MRSREFWQGVKGDKEPPRPRALWDPIDLLKRPQFWFLFGHDDKFQAEARAKFLKVVRNHFTQQPITSAWDLDDLLATAGPLREEFEQVLDEVAQSDDNFINMLRLIYWR